MKIFNLSACTRCGDPILPEEVPQYLENDHLCPSCAGVTDAEHAKFVKASEKQPTVKENV